MSEPWASRRRAFFEKMASASPGSVAVLPSAPVFRRNNDVDHEYRQDSDLFYLTGFDEPESVAVFDCKDSKWFLFVRPRDPSREIWDGPRAGVEGAKSTYGADEGLTVSELDEKLPALLQDRERLYYRLGQNRVFDDRVPRRSIACAVALGRGSWPRPKSWIRAASCTTCGSERPRSK
jgi:Xaa-Pro aminopeptidase